MQSGPLNPERLAPGTRVGPWRIVHRQGRGAYGAVYLVEGVEPGASGPAALKLAQFPRDARFAREAELLSRLRHPCVPRLLGRGHWPSQPGTLHPYFVMEWVEGLSLYVWAWAGAPSSRQVLRVLASLARALERAAQVAGPEADTSLFPGKANQLAEAQAAARRVTRGTPSEHWKPWLAVPVALWAAWMLTLSTRVTVVDPEEESRDAGAAAVGDSVLTAPVAPSRAPSVIALDMPSKPFPKQSKPDAHGRCPKSTQVSINGGCWMKVDVPLERCKDGYVYKGGCYEPAFPPPRPATSDPVESPDGG